MADDPLTLWLAYQNGADGLKHYLGDGKGNIRLFKTETALREYLIPLLTPEQMEITVIHHVGVMFAVPEMEQQEQIIMPISSLAPHTLPTAIELLNNYRRRNGK